MCQIIDVLYSIDELAERSPSVPSITIKGGKSLRDQESALPNPFPLPQNFQAVVEAGIAAKNPRITTLLPNS